MNLENYKPKIIQYAGKEMFLADSEEREYLIGIMREKSNNFEIDYSNIIDKIEEFNELRCCNIIKLLNNIGDRVKIYLRLLENEYKSFEVDKDIIYKGKIKDEIYKLKDEFRENCLGSEIEENKSGTYQFINNGTRLYEKQIEIQNKIFENLK